MKFESVAANKNNYKWEQMIKREEKLYSSNTDVRSEFQRDYTRILHSTAFRRLKNKTQVFYAPENDNISTRIEHVNYVESISYTIAQYLGLNTELTRAISIGHDVGHAPFGHKGGNSLSKISEREIGNIFWHEKNGLFMVDNIELLEDYEGNKKNLDLTYAVRDGIISHCGEIDENAIKPREDAIDLNEYTKPNQYAPYTWEGCVVKISDKISYLGRDIEDGMRMGILDEHINELYDILGKKINNTIIINKLVSDLCENSSIDEGLKFSDDALEMMDKIKAYNYKYIYSSDKLKPSAEYFTTIIEKIYEILKECYNGENTAEKLKENTKFYPQLCNNFLEWIQDYWNISDRNRLKNRILFDIKNPNDYYSAIIYYISGMTDTYAIKMYKEIIHF